MSAPFALIGAAAMAAHGPTPISSPYREECWSVRPVPEDLILLKLYAGCSARELATQCCDGTRGVRDGRQCGDLFRHARGRNAECGLVQDA